MPTDFIALFSPKNLILFVVVFARLSGLMTTAPLISTYPIPIQIKTWFMAMVAFIMFPIVLAKVGFQIPTTMPELTVILLKEFIVGYTIGFIANIVFIGVEISADLVSMQMGLTAAQAMNPMTGDTSSILTQAYTIIAAIVFIGIGGYNWIFTALFKSFQVIHPGYGFLISGTFTHNVILLTCQIFEIGVGLALPIFSVLLIMDVLLGFVAKMMPKMNIFMVSLPAKIFLGLSLFIMLLPAMSQQIQILFGRYLNNILEILGGQ